jgi:hypothetical protein
LGRGIEQIRNRFASYLGCPQQHRVKIYGLLRSGTNYAEALLRQNFYVECLPPWKQGWKHGPCQYADTILYVFLVKDPYAWLVSFHNWERLHNRTSTTNLAAFARERLTHQRLATAWGIDTPIQAWNRSLKDWSALDEKDNTLFVRYEDLIRNADGELSRIGDRFGLKARRTSFVDVSSRADAWRTPNPRRPLDVAYYRDEKYLEEYDESALSVMRAELDRYLLDRFQYRLR